MKNQVSSIARGLQLGAVLLLAFGMLVSVSAVAARPQPPNTPNGVIVHVCPDGYETDDSWGAAKVIQAGSPQPHNFDGNTNLGVPDKDWVKFPVVRTGVYTLTTSDLGPLADTVIELYDGNNQFVKSNDDYTTTHASQIVWTAPLTASGWYYLEVYNNPTSPANPTNCSTVISYTLTLQSKEPWFVFLPLTLKNF